MSSPLTGPRGHDDRTDRWCIIGAGPAGLATAKNFRDASLPFEIVERQDSLGGIWRYGEPGGVVYRSTCMISSKRLSAFRGFPMPAAAQDFLGHREALAYLTDYAHANGLPEHIRYGLAVSRVRRAGAAWSVTFEDGRACLYRGVVVASGHHWDPKPARFPGRFDGRVLHSSEYRTPGVLQGKRVLIVGTGNSGTDIAVESSRVAARTLSSVRQGCHYLPKYFLGRPMDEVMELFVRARAPRFVHRWVRRIAIWCVFGDPSRFGLPRPSRRIMDGRLILNSELVHHVAHGSVVSKPDVAELRGDRVRFTDGSEEEVDVIVHATGFNASLPFLSTDDLPPRGSGRYPDLALHLFHPVHDGLFVVGMIQPDSGAWWLFDDQAATVAAYIGATEEGGAVAQRARGLVGAHATRSYQPPGTPGPHASLRVEHDRYARVLRRLRRDLVSAAEKARGEKARGAR
ncbi:NAD(P)-binding domain-containing protein [Streptomyces canus]|uniref:flavin-containing monooxygenase n=1 Tax=Streptomyces canus TaxID=58343 RepID=UPI00225B91F3|nr:NAD(P)-binding domain-containing protein [Streptomyces canus]MCX4857211.1 NAD(P)-binding domain-containing protein [Streptomyces canus]WSW37413.1 NAD(P)-binding domain-containing protein [Streptomyces canus]